MAEDTVVETTNTFAAWLGSNWYWILLGIATLILIKDIVTYTRSKNIKITWSYVIIDFTIKIIMTNKATIIAAIILLVAIIIQIAAPHWMDIFFDAINNIIDGIKGMFAPDEETP